MRQLGLLGQRVDGRVHELPEGSRCTPYVRGPRDAYSSARGRLQALSLGEEATPLGGVVAVSVSQAPIRVWHRRLPCCGRAAFDAFWPYRKLGDVKLAIKTFLRILGPYKCERA